MAIDLDAPIRFLRTAFHPGRLGCRPAEVARHRWDRPARWTSVADCQCEVPGVATGAERTTLQRVRERQRHSAAAEGSNTRRDRRDSTRVSRRRPRRARRAGGDRRPPRPAAAVVRRSTPHRTGFTCCGGYRASPRRGSRHSRSRWRRNSEPTRRRHPARKSRDCRDSSTTSTDPARPLRLSSMVSGVRSGRSTFRDLCPCRGRQPALHRQASARQPATPATGPTVSSSDSAGGRWQPWRRHNVPRLLPPGPWFRSH